ncbi:nitrogen regulatory protein P-II-like protein [Gossypium australe]|uniref:Nitrogen regulatory protein P-II-like protein n=1 Tax=Gossypium australe TaxID=47621 RepID=A0A5B6VMP4_9ROSI|nr:nitrogen regulatory protein P-II-like protein [Gossypium australe]
MQSLIVPEKVRKEIERLDRQFIWGLEGNKKMALVSWQLILSTKRLLAFGRDYKSHCKYPPPHHYVGSNKVAWGGIFLGSFYTKSAYQMLRESSWNPRNEVWKMSWKFQGPQKRFSWSVDEIIKGPYTWAKQYAFVNKVVLSTRQVARVASTWTGNWIRLNSDGTIKVDSGLLQPGESLETSMGSRFLGITDVSKKCSVFDVELWGILDGLTTEPAL